MICMWTSFKPHEPFDYPYNGEGNFLCNGTMLQLLQMRGVFGGLAHEVPHEQLQIFLGIYGSFVFKNISQQSIRLRLFRFLLMGDATRWLAEFPNDSITSWEELTKALLERHFHPSKRMKIRNNIQNFIRIMGAPLHKT